MAGYPALIDGEKGAYGVTFPDLPGIVAMGASVREVLVNAEEALRIGLVNFVVERDDIHDEVMSYAHRVVGAPSRGCEHGKLEVRRVPCESPAASSGRRRIRQGAAVQSPW